MELVELGNIAKAQKQKLSNKDKRRLAMGAALGGAAGIVIPPVLILDHELGDNSLTARTAHRIGNKYLGAIQKIPPRGTKKAPFKLMFTKLGAAGALAGGAYEYHKIKRKK